MALSDADLKLLGRVRKRSRYSRITMTVLLSLTILSSFAAVWFGAQAASDYPREGTVVSRGGLQDRCHETQQAWLRLFAYSARIYAVMACVFLTSLYAVLWFSALTQRRSDVLILKLVGEASGYPESR